MLHKLPAPKGKKRRKRVGRGIGSGRGVRSTRGQKGQKARSGGAKPLYFEGGQTTYLRRVPKLGGFRPRNKKVFAVVPLFRLAGLNAEVITTEILAENGLLRKGERVKVLGPGKLERKVTVKAHAFSRSAREAIEKAGGVAEVLPS